MRRVLVLGSGGREHSLAWKLAQSSAVDEIVCAPGNVGMAEIGECVPVAVSDPVAVADLAERLDTDLVVIGPDEPAVAGVVDALAEHGRLAFGPRAAAARLEGSKAFMKEVLAAAGVPTAQHRTFTADQRDAALAYLDTMTDLWVIKTDGLASGKGVVVTDSLDVARSTVLDYLSGKAFGSAGTTCVIEAGMVGPELSLFVLCAGTDAVVLGSAQDHKRVGDGDTGPNTGGMGAYTPVPFVTDDLIDEVMAKAVRPTLEELARRGAEYRGVLFCGLMLTADGPKVVEYNVRFGDPECQVLLRRLESDLYTHLHECARGEITSPVLLRDEAAAGICLAVEGYPATPRTGDVIHGLAAARELPGVEVFVAGVSRRDQALVTSAGRVLCVTATGEDLHSAVDRAYAAAAAISYDGMHYRRDIAAQSLPPRSSAPGLPR
jgi:phosphoribosylamine--glycine ligase